MKLRKYNTEQLEKAVQNSFSLAETLKALGLNPCGGNYLILKKAIAYFNLNTLHFTGQLWNKGRETGTKQPTENYLNNKIRVGSFKLKKRLLKEKEFAYECSVCKKTEWLGHPIPLELDHINGNSFDNRLENLRLLCPNCHALTPTYRGKNIKSKFSSVLPD